MNFYKRHIGDITKACGHLSQGQMGAYDLLLDWLYGNEKPLPSDKAAVYRIARAGTKAERDNVEAVLVEFFTLTDAGYTQKRAGEEIAKANERAETNRRIAEEREARRRAAREARMEHESCNNSEHESCTNGQPSQTPDSRLQTRAEARAESANADLSPAAPATRPPCPQKAIIALYHEVLPELRRVREWNETRQKLLSRRWAESPDRQTLDWWRGFFGYVRQSKFLMGQTTGRDGRPFDCDLEWLIRPTNFAKVVEGRYEDQAA